MKTLRGRPHVDRPAIEQPVIEILGLNFSQERLVESALDVLSR